MKNIDRRKLGFRIRIIREEKNISRDELAEKMGVSKSYIYRVEGGRSGFTLDTLHKFARALNVDISIFYTWEDIPNDVTKTKDSEIIWREREKTEADTLKILIEKMEAILAKQGTEIPLKTDKADENYLIELVTRLPIDLQKRIHDKILAEAIEKKAK